MIMMFKEKQLLTGPDLHLAIEKVHLGIEQGKQALEGYCLEEIYR